MFLQVAAMYEEGTMILNERVPTVHSIVRKFFARFTTDKIRCVMKSSSVWYGLYMYMTEEADIDVVLSNLYQIKAIAASKKKTDKIDVVILAGPVERRFYCSMLCSKSRYCGFETTGQI